MYLSVGLYEKGWIVLSNYTMESSCTEETVIENIGIIPEHKPLLGRVQVSATRGGHH